MFSKNLKKIITSAILSFFFIIPAKAFEISPVKMLVTGDPGNNYTVILKIKNTDTVRTLFSASVFGMRQDEQGLPSFERGVSDVESWIFPEENQVLIEPGATRNVNFFIKIPQNTLPGSYYAGLSAEPNIDKKEGAVSGRLVSMLTLQVSGVVNESLQINSWRRVLKNESSDKWSFVLELENTGAVEANMQGEIKVRNFFGREIISEPVVLGNKLLAGAKRVTAPHLDIRNKVWLPGLYEVSAKVLYGKLGQSTARTVYVWFMPFWSKATAGVFLFLFVVFLLKKKIKK